MDSGQHIDLVEYLENIQKIKGSLVIDNQLPSLYNFLGVAYHTCQRVEDSENAFADCVKYNPKDTRCWINLGEARLHQFKIEEGLYAYYEALKIGDHNAASRLLRAKGWSNSWQQFEEIISILHNYALGCSPDLKNSSTPCLLEGTSGLTYMNVPYWVHRVTSKQLPGTKYSQFRVDDDILAPYWKYSPTYQINSKSNEFEGKRLKVGLVSSDFGVHPVSTLLRGMIQYLNTSKIELFCFSLNNKLSWWGTNISLIAEHFVSLSHMNTQEAATEIASRGVEILIDLNGHTLHSGLEVMAHKPSPVQVSYLGFPTSTGAEYIDYYIADYSALPAEGRDAFVEKIAYMPPSCIANDYAQLRGGVLELTGSNRLDSAYLKPREDISKAKFLFTTLSNFQKITPSIFHVWMNIMQTVPESSMVLIEYQGFEPAIKNLKVYSRYFGIQSERLVLSPQAPWIDHLTTKTAIDMILDTPSKNGHTTGLDGIWAGIPTVTLGGGRHMEQRAGESFAEALDSYTGVAFSLKEYEDIAIEYARNERKIKIWREHINRKRVTETLYDTPGWTKITEKLLQAMWEAAHLSMYRKTERFHVLTLPKKDSPKFLSTVQIKDDGNSANPSYLAPESTVRYLNKDTKKSRTQIPGSQNKIQRSPKEKVRLEQEKPKVTSLPNDFFEKNDPLLINIGGYIKKSGWININSQKSSFGSLDEVEIVRELQDLQGFPNKSVDVIYCSHTLEHVPFGDGTLEAALKEWHRVLKPDGMLLIAVPDMNIMAKLLLDPRLTVSERFFVIKMIYGAQSDSWDYHMSGFDESILMTLLAQNHFCEIERVGNFNLFADTSNMIYKDYPISLNIAARKCLEENEEPSGLAHAADEYVEFVPPI